MHGECYIRLCAFDSTHTWESLRMSFIVQRPADEPGFMLTRQEAGGRNIRYETRAYVAEKPAGARY
jgi:ribulose-bisphosphate carboxylase small chain